jgi:hypothetical protein
LSQFFRVRVQLLGIALFLGTPKQLGTCVDAPQELRDQ